MRGVFFKDDVARRGPRSRTQHRCCRMDDRTIAGFYAHLVCRGFDMNDGTSLLLHDIKPGRKRRQRAHNGTWIHLSFAWVEYGSRLVSGQSWDGLPQCRGACPMRAARPREFAGLPMIRTASEFERAADPEVDGLPGVFLR